MKHRTAPISLLHTGLAACLALVVTACSGPPYAARPIENDVEDYTQVVVQNADLRDAIRVGQPILSRLDSGQLKVLAPIRNVTDRELQVLAEVEFKDGDGVPYGDRTPAQVLILSPGGTYTHTVSSMQARAADFVLRLRWNR